MNVLIIFTKLDNKTEEYFENFFPSLDTTEIFKFLIVDYLDRATPAIIFIYDSELNTFKKELTIYLNTLDKKNNYFIFYHSSAREIDNHRELIRSIFPCWNELEDHHNPDGFHFKHVLGASEAYKAKKNAEFINHIKLLTNEC